MMIDLFEAMKKLRKEFGASAYMSVYGESHGIFIRLSAIAGKQRHYSERFITELEYRQSNANVFQIKFDDALELLRHQIEGYKAIKANNDY